MIVVETGSRHWFKSFYDFLRLHRFPYQATVPQHILETLDLRNLAEASLYQECVRHYGKEFVIFVIDRQFEKVAVYFRNLLDMHKFMELCAEVA